MNPDLLCKCAHQSSAHAGGVGECKPSCGCTEFRLAVRPAVRDESATEGAA